jgi:hypothetical protein
VDYVPFDGNRQDDRVVPAKKSSFSAIPGWEFL